MTVKIIYSNGYGIGGYYYGKFSGTAGSVMCDVIKICLKRKGVRRMMMREMDNRRNGRQISTCNAIQTYKIFIYIPLCCTLRSN